MTNESLEQLGERLSAYLDGELSTEDARAVEQLLHDDPDAHRMYEELQRTASLVAGLPKHRAPQTVADAVQARLERSELLGDVAPIDAVKTGRRSSLWGVLSMAAVLTLLVGGVWYMAGLGSRDDDVARLALGPVASEKEIGLDASADAETASTRPGRDVLRKSRSPRRARAKRKADDATVVSSRRDERLAKADFQKKLASGLPRSAIRTHQFSNEAVVLQLPVESEQECEALADRIVDYFARHDTTDLAKATANSGDDTSSGFMYRGKPNVNFPDDSDQQIIVRATRAQLDELMDEVNTATKSAQDVTLIAGPVKIQGLRLAQSALRASTNPATENDEESSDRADGDSSALSSRSDLHAAEREPEKNVTRDTDPFGVILDAMGIDPTAVAPSTDTAKSGATDAAKTEWPRSHVAIANRTTELIPPTDSEVGHNNEGRRDSVAKNKGPKGEPDLENLTEQEKLSALDKLIADASRRKNSSAKVAEQTEFEQHRSTDSLATTKGSTATEPPSLVTKRRNALSMGKRSAGVETKNHLADERTRSTGTRRGLRRERMKKRQVDERANELVTLVVQVQLTPTARARKAVAAKAAHKAKAKQSTPPKNPKTDKQQR